MSAVSTSSAINASVDGPGMAGLTIVGGFNTGGFLFVICK